MKLRHWEVKRPVQNYAVIRVITGTEPSNSIPSVFPVEPSRANSFCRM